MRVSSFAPAAALASAIAVSAPHTAHAETPVIVEGVSDEMREAISAALPPRDPPTTLFEAERVSEEAATRAMVWLRSEGYYAATVTPQANERPASARLLVTLGERFRFAAPAITYLDAAPDSESGDAVRRAISGVQEGEPAIAARVLDAEAAAVAALQNAGYADAEAGERRVIVDHATAAASVEFVLRAGARARLGDLRAEPADALRARFVDRLQNWEEGDPYTPENLRRLRRDMSATGAASRVATRLGPPNESGVRDVILDVEPARRNAYEAGVSYSTTEGVGVQGEWTRRNITGRADALTVAATIAEQQQSLSAQLRRPHAAGLGQAMVFGATLDREEIDAYTRQGASLFASVEATPRLRLAKTYGVTMSYDQFDDLSGNVTEALVLSGFGSIRHDTTTFTLDPRDGAISEARIEPAISTGDVSVGFVRFVGEARGYESFGREDSLTLAARIRAGWIETVSGDADDVPPDRRFYAGGGGSVRGYGYNSLYPEERDALGLSPGGQGLLEGSLEARWRFSNRWGATAFADAGTAFDDIGDAGDLSWGVGVGVRYDLGFAPLRVDIAVPLDDRGGDDYALYISLGQAF